MHKHNQQGYILFLLFCILSLCMSLISIFFCRTVSYQHLMHLLTQKDKSTSIALSSIELGQAMLYVSNENEKSNNINQGQRTLQQRMEDQNKPKYQAFLKKIFPYLCTNTQFKLTESTDGINAIINAYISSEYGKININGLYDFRLKKFINEGQQGDRKKFCEWLFERISKITKEPSLFTTFEKFLNQKVTDLNDVTELLTIQEFAQTFKDNVYFNMNEQSSQNIYLTDIFTIITDSETINPWFFSHSWRILLDIKPKKLSKDEQKKLIESFKSKANWDVDWNPSLKIMYEKDYKDLPKEIKSMLTTECEANIFSLLLSATIGETTATIFTILKKQAIEKSIPFDILKICQI